MCAEASTRRVSMEGMYISTWNGRVPSSMRDSIAHYGSGVTWTDRDREYTWEVLEEK